MKTRCIQAVRHAVVDVGSDHDAILCEFRIVVASRVVTVKGGQINLGPANVVKVFEHLLPALGDDGFLCIDEAGGQLEHILEEAQFYGYRLLGRTGPPGAASTIVLVGPGVRTRATLLRRLLRRVFVGEGAGPDHNKPKWWNGGRVSVDGVVFGISAIHFLASQHKRRRMMWTLQMARQLTAIAVARRVPWLVVGDWNTDFSRNRGLARWMRTHGWTTNHDELGDLDTMGRRSIDAFAWLKNLNIPLPKETR